jgi:hypothetical protein
MGLSSTKQKMKSPRERLSRRGHALSSGGAALIKPEAKLSQWGEGAYVKRQVALTRAGGGGGQLSPPNSFAKTLEARGLGVASK